MKNKILSFLVLSVLVLGMLGMVSALAYGPIHPDYAYCYMDGGDTNHVCTIPVSYDDSNYEYMDAEEEIQAEWNAVLPINALITDVKVHVLGRETESDIDVNVQLWSSTTDQSLTSYQSFPYNTWTTLVFQDSDLTDEVQDRVSVGDDIELELDFEGDSSNNVEIDYMWLEITYTVPTCTLTMDNLAGYYNDPLSLNWTIGAGCTSSTYDLFYREGSCALSPVLDWHTIALGINDDEYSWTSGFSEGEYCIKAEEAGAGTGIDAMDGTFYIDNENPVADADGPYSCDEGGSTTLDASGSTENYEISSYEWRVDGDVVSTSSTYPYNCLDGPASHDVALTVVDYAGNSNTDTSTITESNIAPWGVNSNGPYFGTEDSSVSFTGTASDVSADTVIYYWDFGDGATSTEQNPNHTYTSDGTYTVTLTASDEDGGSTVDSTSATIADVDPTAGFSDNAPKEEGQLVSFTDNSTSYDGIVSWSWDFGDGATSTEQNPTHTYLSDVGSPYTVSLTVYESDGDSSTTTGSVSIIDSTPVVEFSWSPESPNEGQSVQFTDDSSAYDSPMTYLWSFGDGATSTEQNPTHTYGDNGVYTITLAVTDSDGSVVSDSDSISVSNVAPVANAGADQSGVISNSICFTGSVTDQGTLDTHTFSWDFGDGSGPLTTNCHAYSTKGVYTVTLTVTDDDGGVGTDTALANIYDYQIDLFEGWNLISFPLVPANTNLSNVLDPIKDNLEKVWVYKYNETTGKNVWLWQIYDGEEWDGSSGFSDIAPGLGYFIEMSDSDSLMMNGEKMYDYGGVAIPPSQAVSPGWNLIGHYGMIYGLSKPNAFVTLSGNYATMLDKDGTPEFNLYPTEGYWLFVTGTNQLQYAPSGDAYLY